MTLAFAQPYLPFAAFEEAYEASAPRVSGVTPPSKVPSITVNRCRMCGCSEDHPCRLSTGDTCQWHTKIRTVCSNPRCVNRYAAEHAVSNAARRTGRAA